MMKSIKKDSDQTTSFADFINNASSAQKKKVYKDVLKKVSASQERVIATAKRMASC